jgi:ectoine hydroxylase-related dioxygenase (phytanoyl-CoA dioxygenase family)
VTGRYPSLPQGLQQHAAHLSSAGLTGHAFELDTYGYTVVPDALTPAECDEMAHELRRLGALDEGIEPDAAGESHRDRTFEVLMLLARGGDVFKRAVLLARLRPLLEHLLGASYQLSSVTGYLKGPGRCELGIHSDTAYVPDPCPPYAQLANINLCLTDYREDSGGLVVVPGSHKYGHRPAEGVGSRDGVKIIAPRGSAILFSGNTWHGAGPRAEPGLRLTISMLYARLYMRPQEDYRGAFGPDELARFPGLSRLIGEELPTGWRSLGEAADMVARRASDRELYYRTRAQHT